MGACLRDNLLLDVPVLLLNPSDNRVKVCTAAVCGRDVEMAPDKNK